MKVEVIVPEEYMGDVMGDINSRRGRVEGMEARGGVQVIRSYCSISRNVWLCNNLAFTELKGEEHSRCSLITMNEVPKEYPRTGN